MTTTDWNITRQRQDLTPNSAFYQASYYSFPPPLNTLIAGPNKLGWHSRFALQNYSCTWAHNYKYLEGEAQASLHKRQHQILGGLLDEQKTPLAHFVADDTT